MLNFDKDQKLLFQCRPFSNQWPAALGNIIQAGVALPPERVGAQDELALLTFTGGV